MSLLERHILQSEQTGNNQRKFHLLPPLRMRGKIIDNLYLKLENINDSTFARPLERNTIARFG